MQVLHYTIIVPQQADTWPQWPARHCSIWHTKTVEVIRAVRRPECLAQQPSLLTTIGPGTMQQTWPLSWRSPGSAFTAAVAAASNHAGAMRPESNQIYLASPHHC
jgi:hypothetical protein